MDLEEVLRNSPKRQNKNYSEKKKRHTVKNAIVGEKESKKIKGLSKTFEGKKHGKAIMDEWNVIYPGGSKLWKDTGFQGYEPNNVKTHQPKKKPKGKELSQVGRAKVFRIVGDIYRNHKNGFEDVVMEIACDLHNLRLDYSFSF